MNEVEHFVSIFDQQVTLSLNTLAHIPSELWTSIPADSPTNYLGERINRITIEALANHLMNAEDYWISTVSHIAPNEAMAPPAGVQMLKPKTGMALVNQYRQMLAENIKRVRQLSAAQLATPFSFIGRHYTVQGFLWMVYAHHCYHYGQIDLLLRQQSYLPPEFLELPDQQNLIA